MKYDITAYGADPTNVAGSTAAVRAAVAAAKAGGGVIEVPPGTCHTTG
jgi:polygalacturonase